MRTALHRSFVPPLATSLAALLLAAVLLIACGREESRAAETMSSDDPRAEFFDRVAALCGQRFRGEPTYVPGPEHPMTGARLEMHVADCTDSVIRIPFIVDGDRSRTWVLTRGDTGLLFKHDHRHADGTPEDTTMYGGWASSVGSATRQAFPADAYTASLIPDASTNVWTLEIREPDGRFIYDLQRHGQARFRAEFDLQSSADTASVGS